MDDNFEQDQLKETKGEKAVALVTFIVFVIVVFWAVFSLIDVVPVLELTGNYGVVSEYVKKNNNELRDFIDKYKENNDIELPKKIISANKCDLGENNFGIRFVVWGMLDNETGFIYSSNGKPFTVDCKTDSISINEEEGTSYDNRKYHHEAFKKINDNFYYFSIDY